MGDRVLDGDLAAFNRRLSAGAREEKTGMKLRQCKESALEKIRRREDRFAIRRGVAFFFEADKHSDKRAGPYDPYISAPQGEWRACAEFGPG